MKTEEEKDQSSTFGRRLRREVISWLWVIIAFILIEGTLGQARVIPSASMEDTVLIGDHLIVSRFGYDAGVPFTSWHVQLWKNPKRQQIIVFHGPPPESQDLIKRVIGVPGDTLEIRGGVVYVNGAPLAEPYRKDPPNASEFRGPWTVPADSYFMMGDNRENSYDSRFWGFATSKDIIGTPVMIYMSIEAPGEVWDPGHLGDRFATYLKAIVHPHTVRWKRIFNTF